MAEAPDFSRKVKANRKYLVENIRYQDISAYLRQELFSLNDEQEILIERTDQKMLSQCLNMLEKKGPCAYSVFIKALEEDYPWAVAKIQDTEQDEVDGRMNPRMPLTGEITTPVMLRISRQPRVMKEWELFGRQLEVPEADIVTVEAANYRRPSECVYKVLSTWRDQRGLGQATNEAVCQALENMDMAHEAREVFRF